MTLQSVLQRLPKDGPERRAIEAGEIDAIIDYPSSNVVLFPAARRALRAAAGRAAVAEAATTHQAAIHNSLLAALPRAEYQRLFADLEPLTLKFGEVLHEPRAPIRYVYFPIDCVICLLTTVESNEVTEVGLVGYEGMVGVSLVLGVDVATVRALVQAGGTAMRMRAARFHQVFRQCLPLQHALYRYAHAKLALARQTAACSRFHSAEARLARWLLMTSDRVRSEEFFLTHVFLADMLGVRRETITEAASSLHQRDLISYCRGHIRILDRKGLEAASCRCYARIGVRAEAVAAAR
ncbi:MAG TPA: Crp/Fnr family transcriptional regulator [Burkholderiaceae bacterium]|nr:Crp/Fnr family transcriptional regulator [Burkholderiaceae bacterium]